MESTDLFERPEFVQSLNNEWDKYADSKMFDPLDEIARRLLVVMNRTGDSRILDVGCGRGRLLDFIGRRDPEFFEDRYYLGYDKSEALRRQLMEDHIAPSYLNPQHIWTQSGTVYSIPYTCAADVVVCHAVTYHIGDIPAAIEQLWKATKRVLYVTVLWHNGFRHKGVQPHFYENRKTGYAEWCPGNVMPRWMVKRLFTKKLVPKASNVSFTWYKPPSVVEQCCLIEAWK